MARCTIYEFEIRISARSTKTKSKDAKQKADESSSKSVDEMNKEDDESSDVNIYLFFILLNKKYLFFCVRCIMGDLLEKKNTLLKPQFTNWNKGDM